MLILLIRSHCKICPLTTMTISRVCTVGNCWQWANFTAGPNGQNQHFVGLRQNVCLYIHAVVLLRGLPSLECKNELFVGKKEEKAISQIKSDRLKQAFIISKLFPISNLYQFNI